jgi:hypothetical protein
MKKRSAILLVPALALGMSAFAAAPAIASTNGTTYEAQLHALNHSGGTGVAMVTLDGNQVTVDANVSGLAMKFSGNAYPHVAHIHDMGSGECPAISADKNGDGVISTPEGAPAYGGIGATLTTSGDTSPKSALDLKRAFGMGGSFKYHRTFTLDAATLAQVKADNAVIVVHGLDPATLSKRAQKEDSSPLTKALPLAATAPALCGPLHPTQMTGMPAGAAATGGGTASTGTDAGMLALGGGLALVGAAALVARRRLVKAGR